MTPRPLDETSDTAVQWQLEAIRDAMRLIKEDLSAEIIDNHRREKETIKECKAEIKETQAICREEINKFTALMLNFFVSDKALAPQLELIKEKQRIPTVLIMGLCGIILTAFVYGLVHMKGLIG